MSPARGRRRRRARRRRTRSSSGTRRRRGPTPCSRSSAQDRCSRSGIALRGSRAGSRGVGGRSPRSRSRRTTSPCSSSARRWSGCSFALAPRRPVVLASLIPAATLVVHVPLAARAARQRRGGDGLVARRADRRDPEEPRRRLQLPGRGARAARSRRCSCSSASRSSCVSRLPSGAGALVAGSLAVAVILIPVVLARRGADYLIARNTIAAVVPAAVCLGAGFATGRLGPRRRDRPLRALARRSRSPRRSTRATDAPTGAVRRSRSRRRTAPRAIVVTPYMSRTLWRPYLPGLREPAQDGATVARDRRGRPGDRGWLLGGRTSSRRAWTPRGPCGASASSASSGSRRTPSSSTGPTGRRSCRCRRSPGSRSPTSSRACCCRGRERARRRRCAAVARLASRGESNRDAARGGAHGVGRRGRRRPRSGPRGSRTARRRRRRRAA